MRICKSTHCDRPLDYYSAFGWCGNCYQRWRKHGDTQPRPPGTPQGQGPMRGVIRAAHPRWKGLNIAYKTAHNRVVMEHGKASAWKCVDCGEQAAHWSYNGLDPIDERISTDKYCVGCRYSPNPQYYEPRCHQCHKDFDHDRPELSQRKH